MRDYEDMSKQELITLVKRLSMQHEQWRTAYIEKSAEKCELLDEIIRLREDIMCLPCVQRELDMKRRMLESIDQMEMVYKPTVRDETMTEDE